jgi:hypothetical protein
MELVISPSGGITTIYNEVLNLAALGAQRIERASHVEPDASGRWFARIVGGPVLGPFDRRSTAIAAEVAWLTDALLQPTTRAGVG